MNGLKLLSDFVESCIFLHDDWNPSIGVNDWDSYDTNPFLLEAKACVVDSLQGYGEEYLSYLIKIHLLPSELILPKSTQITPATLTERLASDQAALSQLSLLVKTRNLALSVFYRYDQHSLKVIENHVKSSVNDFNIYPAQLTFIRADNRINCRKELQAANLPLPLGTICYESLEVLNFARYALSKGFSKIILKQEHRNSRVLLCDKVTSFDLDAFNYPLVAEAVYNVQFSPVTQGIRWKNKTKYLFTLEQQIDNFHFVGNRSLSEKWQAVEPQCRELFQKTHELFPDHLGVFGVDFILTEASELLIVDVNPRFNSSTYPFFFLQKRMDSGKSRIGNFRIVDKLSPMDLSEIYRKLGSLAYDPKRNKGILLFNPVLTNQNSFLKKWSFLLVSESIEEEKRQLELLGERLECVF